MTPVTSLPIAAHRDWVRGALVRLLGCVTRDDRHLDDPAGWLAERTGAETAWRMVGEGRPSPRLVIRRDDDVIEDAGVRFLEAVEAVWAGWLAERGWERADEHDFFRRELRYRSPSGHTYLWRRAGDPALCETVVVALGREGLRAVDELERADRKLRGLVALADVVGSAA